MAVRKVFHTSSFTITLSFYVCLNRPDDLYVLNSIREIQGALRIESWDENTFPYLSNLEYIGCNMSTPLEMITSPHVLGIEGCDLQNNPVAVLINGNTNTTGLDLSSLKGVCGGSVVMFNNPQLCYVGEFDRYFQNSSQVTCHGDQYARKPEQCGNFSFC